MTRSGYTMTATAFRIGRAVAAFALAGLTCLVGSSPSSANPPLEPLADQAPASVTDGELSRGPQGIRFRIEQRPLGDVLQAVRNRTSVEFELASGVRDMPVTAGFDSPDWASALRRLLRDFDHVLIYDDDGSLQRVVVTGHRDTDQGAPPPSEVSKPDDRRAEESGSRRTLDGPPSDTQSSSSGPPERPGTSGDGPPEDTPHRAGPPEGAHHPGPPGSGTEPDDE